MVCPNIACCSVRALITIPIGTGIYSVELDWEKAAWFKWVLRTIYFPGA